MSRAAGKCIIRPDSYALFVCEGAAEEVLIKKLNEAGILPVAPANLIDITRIRDAKGIESTFLQMDFELPVQVIRVVDSPNERFKTSKLYEGRYTVVNVHTRPEIEMLVVHKEGEYDAYQKAKKKPSEFCVENLGLTRIKSKEFLETYWDVDSIIEAAETYKRKHRFDLGEHCLRDLWV